MKNKKFTFDAEDMHINELADTDNDKADDKHTDMTKHEYAHTHNITGKYEDVNMTETAQKNAETYKYTDEGKAKDTYTHTHKYETEIVVIRKEPRNRRLNFLASETAFSNLKRFSEENRISMNEVINQFLESLYK